MSTKQTTEHRPGCTGKRRHLGGELMTAHDDTLDTLDARVTRELGSLGVAYLRAMGDADPLAALQRGDADPGAAHEPDPLEERVKALEARVARLAYLVGQLANCVTALTPEDGGGSVDQ